MIGRLIFVRHGETESNLRGVAQGWSDSALSPRGERQIRQVAARLAAMRPAALFTSPLPRAVTTAEEIGRLLGIVPVATDDLREMHCGRWEGESFADLRVVDREMYERWAADPMVRCPEGESYYDVRERIVRAVETVMAMPMPENGESAVLVSHGTAIRVAATALLDLPLQTARRFAQDNAAVSIFERRHGRWVMKLWNDTTHCEAETE